MDNRPETPAHSSLAGQAEACRTEAEHFSDPERELLLKMASSFDQIASGDDIRTAVEADRCW